MTYNVTIGRDDSDKKRFLEKGLIKLGKGYVKMGQYTSLSNPIFMDVARSHVILVAGKRGSGKSYTLGVIAEELSTLENEEKKNTASLIFDTMGIFWTMKFKNEKEKELLQEWGEKPKNVPVKIFAPRGYFQEYEKRQIPVDEKFSIKVSELQAEDWVITFNLNITDPAAVTIERAVTTLAESEEDFGIEEIIKEIEKDKISSSSEKNASIGLFEAARTWKVFSKKGEPSTKISDLIEAGKTSVLDLSVYSSVGVFNVRALIIGLICRKLFNERTLARKKEELEAVQHGIDYLSFKQEREFPLVWIFIDECLTGDTEIITSKAHTPMQEIVKRFDAGEKFKVLGYDTDNNCYNHHDVKEVFSKGKRRIMELTTETGKKIRCTPEHRVLTSEGFASAFSVNDIASPLYQHYSENKELIEARILGHLFGDGWISDKTKSLGFSGKGSKEDLEKIRKNLADLGFKSTNVYERKTHSQINYKGKINSVNGTSQSFMSTSAYKYFREKAGFTGEKTLSPTRIPESVMNSSQLRKSEFLAALMGSDGSKISTAKNAGGDFNAIRFSFNKIESLEKEAFEYANQIKKLFEDVGVKVSSITKNEGNLRRDGNKTIRMVLTLEKNTENTIRFLDRIGYRYCSEKEIEGIKWSSYLKARLFLKKEREKVYEKAIELHKQGLGKTKISKMLNFPVAQIRDWIYNKMMPGLPKKFPDIDDWADKRIKNDILFERVFRVEDAGEEEVYDISVDNVHNFISNGFITHNCHEFIPSVGKTPATDALIQLLREGRQPGISMVMATQQPGSLARDAITQADIVISHRVTSMPDIQALNEMMQSYLFESIKKQMDDLPNLKGSAVILDDNSERVYPCRIKPRFTWHGGEAPTSVRVESRM